jgi:hypothetical protein
LVVETDMEIEPELLVPRAGPKRPWRDTLGQ